MYRCVLAVSFALSIGLAGALPAVAQELVQRPFPANALRGLVGFGPFPEITLNGQPARLAPGARVRGQDNMLATPSSLAGQRWTVNYTVEPTSGMLMDVWVLRRDELSRRPWPRSAEEAARWTFDPAAQTWSRP